MRSGGSALEVAEVEDAEGDRDVERPGRVGLECGC